VDWSKIAHLESGRIFIVRTEDGSVYRGSLNTTGNGANGPMNIEVIEPGIQKTVLEQSRVIRMDQTSGAFWQRFNGTIISGLTYSKGNQATQYNLGFETKYLRERWSARMDYDSNLASSSGDTTSTRNHLRFDARHLLPRPHYFYGGLVSFLQSSEQGIRVQTIVGAAVGRFLKNTNRTSIAVLGGVAVQRTNYVQSIFPVPRQDVGAAMAGVELKLFRFDRSNVDITARMFPAISDPGRCTSRRTRPTSSSCSENFRGM
jgi:hypothetical protein